MTEKMTEKSKIEERCIEHRKMTKKTRHNNLS
jgi:hypothetical protein